MKQPVSRLSSLVTVGGKTEAAKRNPNPNPKPTAKGDQSSLPSLLYCTLPSIHPLHSTPLHKQQQQQQQQLQLS